MIDFELLVEEIMIKARAAILDSRYLELEPSQFSDCMEYLIDRLRQAEKDSARYRWLKNQPWFECEAEWCMPVNMNAVGYDFFASIDGVIDEAMKCSK